MELAAQLVDACTKGRHRLLEDRTPRVGSSGSALEVAFAEAYGASGGAEKVSETESHSDDSFNRLVLIDHTKPEEDVYGTNHVAGLGQIVTWLQAVPASIDAHKADVREMAETLAMAVVGAEPPEPRPAL